MVASIIIVLTVLGGLIGYWGVSLGAKERFVISLSLLLLFMTLNISGSTTEYRFQEPPELSSISNEDWT